jgi:hypothetical protein
MMRWAKSAATVLVGAVALVVTTVCTRSPAPLPAPRFIAAPDSSEVESVIFLMGDAGDAQSERSPVLHRLAMDIEAWSARLDRDSAVAMLVLGDVVYPEGLRPQGTGHYSRDTAVVMSQVRLVSGPAALARGSVAYFLAGNHDWGLRRHWPGYIRLRNLEEFLDHARTVTGANVRLSPPAGSGGPEVVDFGQHVRLLLLDTAWWLLEGDEAAKEVVLEGIDRAMAEAVGREIVVAAHHPFASAGPHGGQFSFWETAGFRYILYRSGAILQDITSGPYRELERGLRPIFSKHGPPVAFVGGHEHSLQLLEGVRPSDPRFHVVSGSMSKNTEVGKADGLLFGVSAPGYVRLMIERDGGMTLFVEAAPPEFLHCPAAEPARAQCMQRGLAAFRTMYSVRIK